MSTLFNTLKSDLVKARLSRNVIETNTLRTLIGDIELAMTRPGATSLDEVTHQTLTSFAKNAKICRDQAVEQTLQWTKDTEIEIYNRYLPKLMSETLIREIIIHNFGDTLVEKQKRDVMMFMKTNHTGQYDGALVSSIFNTLKGN